MVCDQTNHGGRWAVQTKVDEVNRWHFIQIAVTTLMGATSHDKKTFPNVSCSVPLVSQGTLSSIHVTNLQSSKSDS